MVKFNVESMLLLLAASQELPTATNAQSYATVPYAKYQKFWTDAGDVLRDLENYQALWIKPHGCV